MTTEINNISQLSAIFPELPERNRYKSALNRLIKSGVVFSVTVLPEGKSYKGKQGLYAAAIHKGESYFFIKKRREFTDSKTTHKWQTPTSWGQLGKYVAKLNNNEFSKCVCERCGGSGRLVQFSHIENGLCFECLGIGYTGYKI